MHARAKPSAQTRAGSSSVAPRSWLCIDTTTQSAIRRASAIHFRFSCRSNVVGRRWLCRYPSPATNVWPNNVISPSRSSETAARDSSPRPTSRRRVERPRRGTVLTDRVAHDIGARAGPRHATRIASAMVRRRHRQRHADQRHAALWAYRDTPAPPLQSDCRPVPANGISCAFRLRDVGQNANFAVIDGVIVGRRDHIEARATSGRR